jgi:hypothetical protein
MRIKGPRVMAEGGNHLFVSQERAINEVLAGKQLSLDRILKQ